MYFHTKVQIWKKQILAFDYVTAASINYTN